MRVDVGAFVFSCASVHACVLYAHFSIVMKWVPVHLIVVDRQLDHYDPWLCHESAHPLTHVPLHTSQERTPDWRLSQETSHFSVCVFIVARWPHPGILVFGLNPCFLSLSARCFVSEGQLHAGCVSECLCTRALTRCTEQI